MSNLLTINIHNEFSDITDFEGSYKCMRDICGHINTHMYEAQLYAVEVGARGSPDNHCGHWQADLG